LTTTKRFHLGFIGRMQRRLLLPLFGLALLGAIWSAVLYQISVERELAHHGVVAHSQSLARTLADHVSHILRQTDHATQLFKLKFEETDGALRLPEFTRHNGLMDSVLPARLDLPVALVDASGHVIDVAHGLFPDNVSGQPYFDALRDGALDAPMFSTPMVEPRTKKWLIQVARRLNDRQGNFAGVVVIHLDPAYFVDDYDRLNVTDEGALVLMSRDGGYSVGRTGDRLFISDTVDFVPARGSLASPDELVPGKPLDTVARVYSFHDMPRYALTAVVGLPQAVAMAPFERHRKLYLGISFVATVLILAVVALLMDQSARLRASISAAHDAQATLRAAADGSLDSFFVLKAWPANTRPAKDFVVVDANERGAALVGVERDDLIGSKIGDVLPHVRQNGFYERYQSVIDSGQPLEQEMELRPDGRNLAWVHFQIVPIPGGVAITARDISDRKRADIEIRENRTFLQSMVDHLPLLIYVKSARGAGCGNMVVWNAAAETVTGLLAAQVIGQRDSDVLPPGLALLGDPGNCPKPEVLDLPEQMIERPDGSVRYLHAMSVPLFDEDGSLEYILCIAEDVTRRREQEQALIANQAELAAVNDASPLGLLRADKDGKCTYVNRTLEGITGLTRQKALGDGWLTAVHPDDRSFVLKAQEHMATSRTPFKATVRCVHPDGRLVWTSVKFAAIRIDDEIEGYVGSVDDITTLREAELALVESESRLRTIADTVPAMVAYIDADLVYRFHNIAYEREFGREGTEVHGRKVREIVGEGRYSVLEPYLLRALAGETVAFEEVDYPNGIERNLEVMYIPQRGESGTVLGLHVIRQDVTTQQSEKKRLLKLAQIDALTGLTNRAGFTLKLTEAMTACKEHRNLMAVMYMDIDHFKPVNDTYGHNVGDALLKAFSGRLTHALRGSDTVARLGGDEFTIIMEKLGKPEDASSIASKIVAVMRTPFHLDGLTVSVSASIGLAFYRGGDQTPEGLLNEADVQLYAAKQAGRSTYRAAA
jgi:diguanylate cyclase (GGDEF)-like protein/PAS domain S-box-containing protein